MNERLCPRCGGTILDRARCGVSRGTCHCRDHNPVFTARGSVLTLRQRLFPDVPPWRVEWCGKIVSQAFSTRAQAEAHLADLLTKRAAPAFHRPDKGIPI